MRKLLLALSGAAVALTVAPVAAAPVTGLVCVTYKNGVCVKTKKVRGTPHAAGYVFGPKHVYTPVSDLPPPLVTQYSLTPEGRYVYHDGYIYVVDPTTYAVTRIIDTIVR
jgi:hypothetical protein